MASPVTPRRLLVDWLQERSTAILACESKAHSALYDNDNEVEYRELMIAKASLLASIAEDAAPLANALPAPDKVRVRETLVSFSANARNALSLDSVFYMSALLYPDDHKDGDLNNLEKLIASLAG